MTVKLKIGACVIRKGGPDDIDLVYRSWLNSYRESPKTHPCRNGIYYAGEHKIIEDTISRRGTSILCAVNPEDTTQIFGWVCAEEMPIRQNDFTRHTTFVHYVFVKSTHRRLGVCTELLKALKAEPPLQYSHWTKDWSPIAERLGASYNPYMVEPK